ncbi:MAG: tRNA-intron lyase [Methanobrevibacter sp.]|uniref:tRNA-intron lyase n=1 Tax=Methanobrevibacter sp. TaxID=66852 RepID=UPI0025F96901|nr:tRNA-intron lyase [Methanobrevibacter sp.]MBR3113180.1 tRNA-intron lyase [Methanobrevibacter sp.]MBR6993450.1 tRNA-intron lyase [Methanobrevibacter sp.]
MRGNLSNDIVSIKIEEGSKRPISLHEKSLFGKIEADTLNLSLIEACYLLEKGRLDIYEDDIECTVGYLIDILKEQGIYGKYIVYRDLKDRGFVIKTGFKYGAEFRLYNRGGGPGQSHSDYLVKVMFENYEIDSLDFASYIRVAHGVNKKFLLAIVDDDFDITYYNVEWTRP